MEYKKRIIKMKTKLITKPITIKTKTGFTTLNDVHDVEEFYLAGVEFIENCLKECWERKAQAEKSIIEAHK